MAQILLILEVLFTQDSKAKDMFCDASLGCEPRLFSSSYLFSLRFKSILDGYQHLEYAYSHKHL